MLLDKASLTISIIALLCLIVPLNCQIEYGLLSKDGRSLKLLKLASYAQVEGSYAQIEFSQFYRNPYGDPIETEFLFPRTDSSIFHKFEALFRDQVIVGKIYEKEEAKVMYQESINQGHTAAYSERNVNTPDVMKILVGNIPPGETVEIKYSIIQPLELIANKVWSFTLPVVLTERYTLSNEPSEDIVYIQNVDIVESKYKDWYVHVEVKADTPFELLSNPSHNLIPAESDETKRDIKTYKAIWHATLVPNKNFVVYFKPQEIQAPSVVLAEHPEHPNDYAMLVNFVPELNNLKINYIRETLKDMKEGFLRLKKLVLEQDKQHAKGEFIFIIDRSGSMYGHRIENLKKALKKFLEVLPADSYFNIISFGSDYSMYESQSMKNSVYVRQRVNVWIDSIDANMGGTEVLAPMQQAVSLREIEAYPRIVMLLTDGDVTNPDGVIKVAFDHAKRMRFCTVGIGNGASEYLVKNIAKVGGGTSAFVLDNEDIGDKAINMVESAVSQHLKDINLKVECYNSDDTLVKVYTKTVEVLLKDRPFNEWVYLKDIKDLSHCHADISYFNSLTDSYVNKQMTIDGFDEPEVTDYWHKIAYDAKIRELDEKIRFGRGEISVEQLKKEVVKISTKYQILSDYTSFFAVLPKKTVDKKATKVNIENVNSADYNRPNAQASYDRQYASSNQYSYSSRSQGQASYDRQYDSNSHNSYGSTGRTFYSGASAVKPNYVISLVLIVVTVVLSFLW